jgi:hypothetical protein
MTPVPRGRVIPTGAWVLAGVIAAVAFLGLNILFLQDPQTPPPAQVIVPVLAAGFLGGYVLLIGFIYGDAKRRGMRYIPWTILAALAPSAIGIILYFILRDPMPMRCTKCGCAMHPRFAYCPRCGATMSATCGQCHRVTEAGWSHCAWCGTKLGA